MTGEAPYGHDPRWPVLSLREITTKIGSGATPRGGAETYLPERQTFAFVRSQNVFDRRFDTAALAFISDAQADGLRGVSLQPGDVLLNITGDGVTFGRAAMVDDAALPACVNQHVSIVRADRTKVEPGYLLAYLTHPDVKPYVASFNSGGSRRAITKGHIESFRVPIPPIETQRAIAATLGVLDEKIESNRRSTALAEKLGDALFAQSATQEAPLSDVADLTMGSSPPGSSYNENRIGLPFYQGVRDFGRRYPNLRVWTTAPVRFAQPNDTLVSVRAPVGNLNRASVACCIGRGVASVRSSSPSTIYYSLRTASHLWQPFQQEGTIFGAINRTDLEAAKLPWPAPNTLAGLEERLSAIDELIASVSRETGQLISLRDTLLPELLAGRIRVAPLRDE